MGQLFSYFYAPEVSVATPPPQPYNGSLTDVDDEFLKELGAHTGIENLSEGEFPTPAFPVEGIFWGPNHRWMICLTCRHATKPGKTIRVWFIVVTGCYSTFLSRKTIEALVGPSEAVPDALQVSIQDLNSVFDCHVATPGGHCEGANILGHQALSQLKVILSKEIETFRLDRH